MPQYFFSIRSSDAEAKNDPHGTNLPDLGAALSYAERTISELQKERKYKPPGSMVIVTDQAGRTVLSLPFFPGCA